MASASSSASRKASSIPWAVMGSLWYPASPTSAHQRPPVTGGHAEEVLGQPGEAGALDPLGPGDTVAEVGNHGKGVRAGLVEVMAIERFLRPGSALGDDDKVVIGGHRDDEASRP